MQVTNPATNNILIVLYTTLFPVMEFATARVVFYRCGEMVDAVKRGTVRVMPTQYSLRSMQVRILPPVQPFR